MHLCIYLFAFVKYLRVPLNIIPSKFISGVLIVKLYEVLHFFLEFHSEMFMDHYLEHFFE